MIKAYHIIGLKGMELGRLTYQPEPEDLANTQAAIQARFAHIKEAGFISARCHLPQDPYGNPGPS